MSKLKLAREFGEYIVSNKKLWLLPILILFALIALAALLSQSQALAPFIYSLF